jgi:hypothetical protein
MVSLSSSATSSSSSSSLCASSSNTNPSGRSSVSVLRPSYMLQSLSEYVSPSLSKAFFSSSVTTNDDKTATLTPLNNNPIQSNTIRHASFTGKILMRQTLTKKILMIIMTFTDTNRFLVLIKLIEKNI